MQQNCDSVLFARAIGRAVCVHPAFVEKVFLTQTTIRGGRRQLGRGQETDLPAFVEKVFLTQTTIRGGRRQLGRGQETDLPVQRRWERGVRAGRAGLCAVHEVRQRN